jgi:hypothetical protein
MRFCCGARPSPDLCQLGEIVTHPAQQPHYFVVILHGIELSRHRAALVPITLRRGDRSRWGFLFTGIATGVEFGNRSSVKYPDSSR